MPEGFAAVRLRRKAPEFKNCRIIDDIFERERILHSFAIEVRYIGRYSKVELREYLWGPEGRMNPEVLKGADFEEVEMDDEFRIPDEVMEEIKKRGEEEERRFREEMARERADVLEHLRNLLREKEAEGRDEEARNIREEIERREKMEIPELKVKVRPVALLAINSPIEVHHTKLENEYAKREVTWKFDTLTGEHDLKCEGCGKSAMEFYLTVDGIACESCLKECKECGKPMINAHTCKVCSAPLCDEHVHFCSTCHVPICEEHSTKCEFCSNEMCPDHVNRCKVCGAPLCSEHTYTCAVCGETIGPKHARICESCGRDVCPDHIHTCSICRRNVCENCAVKIGDEWYCKEHLEVGYSGKFVFPKVRCKTCGIALAEEDVQRCEVCNAPLCGDHALRCEICGKVLCEDHALRCETCGKVLCEDHAVISEASGRVYCEDHASTCKVCGRLVGQEELRDGVCEPCRSMREISRKSIPKEIFIKFPYAKRGREWYLSKGKNTAYITEVKGVRLAYRVKDGEIVEHRSKIRGR